ncbi:MAG: radical SAM protein [Acidobacteriota bacterium]
MECAEVGQVDDFGSLEQLQARAWRERVPLDGSIEITRRCNLDCVHCYLGRNHGDSRTAGERLTTPRILALLDEIAEAGCLFLLLTGGEPLLHPDFELIYRRAKANGLLVTVFTNGTVVTPETADLFAAWPPQAVEITLYGAGRETYRRLTGSGAAFDKCLAGVALLKERGVTVRLKTVLLTVNLRDVESMERIAAGSGLDFRFDPVISECRDGDPGPVQLRLSPDRIIDLEFNTAEKIGAWRKYVKSNRWKPDPDLLYNCAAGAMTFHVAANGVMYPCMMVPDLGFDLMAGTFKEGWESMAPIRHRKAPSDYACNHCETRNLCNFCPPAVAADRERGLSFCCDVSRKRVEVLTNLGVELRQE